MSSSDALLRNARAEISGLGRQPRRRLAVVTCMDCRVDPLATLGLAVGDAHIIRNAGGVVTADVVRSLAVSQRKLGTNAIDVMMHLDCGMVGLDERALRAEIEAEVGRPVDIDFRSFPDLMETLNESVAKLRSSAALANRSRIRGLMFDEGTRRASVVVT